MAQMIEIPTAQNLSAYLTAPEGTPRGAVIVIHEVWGLTDHTKSVADRVATEGYLALAPSLLDYDDSTAKQLPELQQALFDPARRNNVQPKLRELLAPTQSPEFANKTTARLLGCFDYLNGLPEAHQSVAVWGFCFGGSYAFSLAMQEPQLKLAIPFYGHCDLGVEELRKIKCPVRAFYGEQDERLMAELPDLEQRMEAAGVDFEPKVYPNCGHAFFNDTNPYAYNQDAATDAWKRVKELFIQYL